jgi:Uma2 family endonuclease
MRAVLLNAPESLLEERRRLGIDRWDELWNGELHMSPPPSGDHQRLGTRILAALLGRADAIGLITSYETGLYRTAEDYRVPDVVVARSDQCSERGVEGAVFVVEVRSPHDESYEKLPWYAARGVSEVLLIEPETRAVELYVLRGGQMRLVQADDEGRVRSAALGVAFRPVAGPRLRVERPEDAVEI